MESFPATVCSAKRWGRTMGYNGLSWISIFANTEEYLHSYFAQFFV